MHHVAWLLLLMLSLAGVVPSPLSAQEPAAGIDIADRAPRFMIAAAESAAPAVVDAGSVAVLRRRISLDLEDVTLEQALTSISREAGLRLMYSKAVVPLESRVRLQARGITVAGALTEVLLDAGVDVLLTSNGQAVLTRRAHAKPKPAVVQGGTVTGRVADAKTNEGLGGAELLLEGTKWRTGTDEGGRYRLVDVTPGSYTLIVRRIGYAKQSQPVTVVDGQELTVDVALQPVPTHLDEIVTTVTGEQRLRELGHVVGRINADSLVREAPVASVTELLNARVPGLQVFTGQGTVGGDAAIRIRGATTTRLAQEPIVIVDGVRYASDRKAITGLVARNHEPTSRLNDLNPNDIETIEIVKGPSAATLYGTDAVNGVIVITTKRGRPGPASWNAYARASMSEIPVTRFPDGVRGWSATSPNCTLSLVAQGSCVQDSITTIPNPLNDPELTIFGNAPRWEYGANVAGGGSGIQYFVSADFEDASGPLRMPAAMVEQLKERRGVTELPEEQLEPNAFTKINLRSNVTASLADEVDLRVSAGYTENTTRTTNWLVDPYSSGGFGGTPDAPYGGTQTSPDRVYSTSSGEQVSRFTGSVRLDARPRPWLATWGSVGLDLASSVRHGLSRPDEGNLNTGGVDDVRRRDLLTTADLGTRASFQLGRISSRTAVGAQYVRTFFDGMDATGRGLSPGGETVSSATTHSATASYSETVTLGGYLEQTVGLNERLFLTGAVRADGASSFGRDYKAVAYPKASASWLLSEEPFLPRVPGLDDLRLRYAYGASGRQPTAGMALPGYLQANYLVDGDAQLTLGQNSVGNPDLRPERTREHELGFDAGLLDGRVRLEGTWYSRSTVDGIQSMALQPGYGFVFVNVGLIKDRGFEAQLWTRVIDSRSLTWDLSLQHSSNTNRVISIGDAVEFYNYRGGLVEGYAVGARLMVPLLGYEDANGNGIIEQSEVVIGDSAVYAGLSTPPQTQTLNTAVGLFNQRVRLSAMFERRAGFTQNDDLSACGSGYCRAAVDPSTPLDVQAQVAARGLYPASAPGGFAVGYTFMDEAAFIRLREVAVAVDLPDSWVRALRLRHVTLGLSARNVARWTSFRGIDAESVIGAGSQPANASNGAGGLPGGIPQTRSWVVRFDVGL